MQTVLPDALVTHRAHSTAKDPRLALATLHRELQADTASAVLLYCSGNYEQELLGATIEQAFRCPVVACTSAGQIGPGGFLRGGITGVSLSGGDLSLRTHLLTPLSSCRAQAARIAREQAERLGAGPCRRSFGVLLVDGLSLGEEFVASALYEAFGNVPIVGGSAAPLPGKPAGVYYGGRFHADAAVVALFETATLEFSTFSAQHFVPSSKKLVITLADPEQRLVREINGEPAARAYARALGVDVSALTARYFACHPLMLDLGGERLPRAIRAKTDDGSLLLACAIEEGLVLSIADSSDPVQTLRASLDSVTERIPERGALLVFDCILRRTELEARGLDAQVGALLDQHGAIGFSGWGEQHGPIHHNHTLTGIALGPQRAAGRAP